MLKKEYVINITHYDSLEELSDIDNKLIAAAAKSAKNAYSPYSKFKVGAAILLANGDIITGNNQENSAYPSGLCAERTAAFFASANYPNIAFKKIAIYAVREDGIAIKPVTPCGSCRQVLAEYENKFNSKIEIILANDNEAETFESVEQLLPYSFGSDFLK